MRAKFREYLKRPEFKPKYAISLNEQEDKLKEIRQQYEQQLEQMESQLTTLGKDYSICSGLLSSKVATLCRFWDQTLGVVWLKKFINEKWISAKFEVTSS